MEKPAEAGLRVEVRSGYGLMSNDTVCVAAEPDTNVLVYWIEALMVPSGVMDRLTCGLGARETADSIII